MHQDSHAVNFFFGVGRFCTIVVLISSRDIWGIVPLIFNSGGKGVT